MSTYLVVTESSADRQHGQTEASSKPKVFDQYGLAEDFAKNHVGQDCKHHTAEIYELVRTVKAEIKVTVVGQVTLR